MKQSQAQRRHCINLLNKRLTGKTINQEQNKEVVSGYKAAIDIIRKGITNINRYDISELKTSQSRAIAFIAVDFVNGITPEKVLLRIPLKKQK